MPAPAISPARPWKSAGVGAGALVLITTRKPTTDEQAGEQPEAGERTGHGREAITDALDAPPRLPIRVRPGAVSARGRGAWPRAGGPSCPASGAAAAGVDAVVGADGGGVGRRRPRSRRMPLVAVAGASASARPLTMGAVRSTPSAARPRSRPASPIACTCPVRSRAARRLVLVAVRGPTRPRRPPALGDPGAGGGELPPSDRHAPERDVERPQQQGQRSAAAATGPCSGWSRSGRGSTGPRRRGSRRRRSRAQRRQERLVGAQQPVLGRGRRDEADRPPSGEVPGLIWVTRTA